MTLNQIGNVCLEQSCVCACVCVLGVVSGDSIRCVELVSRLLANLLTSGGPNILDEIQQFPVIVELIFQVVDR